MPGHKTDCFVQANSMKNNWVNKLCVCDMKLFYGGINDFSWKLKK